MAIVDGATIWTAASATNNSTLAAVANVSASVGTVVLVVVSSDNTSTTDGDNSEITNVSDNAGGNTYTKLAEYANGSPGAAAGCVVAVWQTKVAAAITAFAHTITVTFANSRVAKCAVARRYAVGGTLTQSATAVTTEVNGANDFDTSSFSGLPSLERLYFRGLAKEANSTTALTVTSGFTEITGTRSHNSSLAVIVRAEFKIATSTGETSNPTLAVSGDSAGVFLALAEVPHTVINMPDEL